MTIIIAALILVMISRPLGILFILPTLLYFFVQTRKKIRIILIPFFFIGAGVLIYITNTVFSTIADVTITLAASQECIVCGVIPKHVSPIHLVSEGSPIYQLYYYVTHNFAHFLRLSILKLKYFFMMSRSYYSNLHNAVLLIFVIPIYVLGLVYIFSGKKKILLPFFVFQISSILLFSITIMLQCDDYHNRFILSLYPVFLLMAVKGWQILKAELQKRSMAKPASLS